MDAKYKAHLADLDEVGWRRFAEEARAAHRADIHQVLAYAALFDADEVVSTLVYPLRGETYRWLAERGRDVSTAELVRGGRRVVLREFLAGLHRAALCAYIQNTDVFASYKLVILGLLLNAPGGRLSLAECARRFHACVS